MTRLLSILRLWPGPTRPLGRLREDPSLPVCWGFLHWPVVVWTPSRLRHSALADGPDLSSGMVSNDEIDAAP
jgi:hypothetical protein